MMPDYPEWRRDLDELVARRVAHRLQRRLARQELGQYALFYAALVFTTVCLGAALIALIITWLEG
jgi:GAF domain-containing protein